MVIPSVRFQLIDDILEQADDRIVAIKQVTGAEEYLADHFPGFPILPGVFMLEAMVQAARHLLDRGEGPRLVLGQVRALRYGAMVRPGEAPDRGGHRQGGSEWALCLSWDGAGSPSGCHDGGWFCRSGDSMQRTVYHASDAYGRDRGHLTSAMECVPVQETMTMSRDEIFEKVREVLEEALGADEDEVTLDASLTADLEAESIDFLDIVFRLEKTFSTADRPFKISQGELFPENLMENAEWVTDGKFTDAGMTMLRERMPHIDFTEFDSDRDLAKVADLITVRSIVEFINRKLTAA